MLTSLLRAARYEVVGLDCDWYRDCDFGRIREPVPSFDTDLRDIEFADLLAFDAVIHLASVPEDFDGQIDPSIARDINDSATLRLAECCKLANVSRLLFASSCAVYGSRGSTLLDETGPTMPISDYARSKLRCEFMLDRLADQSFAPVVLRLATMYGVSPRLRIDTSINDFVASAVACGKIDVQTAGQALRPFMHVEDVARAFLTVLAAPNDLVAGQVFNVARTDENFRILDAAEMVSDAVSGTSYTINENVKDRRSYAVCGDKLLRTLPGLSYRWTLPDGVRQLRDAMAHAGMTPAEWRCGRFRRLMRLHTLVQRGEVTPSLRVRRPALVA